MSQLEREFARQKKQRDYFAIVSATTCPLCLAEAGDACSHVSGGNPHYNRSQPRADFHSERKALAEKLWAEVTAKPEVIEHEGGTGVTVELFDTLPEASKPAEPTDGGN